MKVKFFVAVFVIFLPLGLASDTQHRFKVAVSVTIKDETTKSIILSYIKRELRSLGDVDVVSIGEEWNYQIVAVLVEHRITGTDRKSGSLSIAWTVHQSFYVEHLSHGDVVWYPRLLCEVGPTENLDQYCKEIVAYLDTDYIEVLRATIRRLKKGSKQ